MAISYFYSNIDIDSRLPFDGTNSDSANSDGAKKYFLHDNVPLIALNT
ncbi:hypothetical protein [Colwellia sp. MT41]|nr:hypothetical protein [Colwellia sp. MT41]